MIRLFEQFNEINQCQIFDDGFNEIGHDVYEALKLSQYKDWEDEADWKMVNFFRDYFRKNYKNVSRNGYRLYIPIEINFEKAKIDPPVEITTWLGWYGYFHVDYRKGTCRDKRDGREIRLGRLFQREGREDLLKIFMSDPKRDIKETKFYVVISCHPYDIMGMSTGRGWSSCLDMEDQKYGGHHIRHLSGHLNRSDLVAYLIRRNDTNIKNPISRCILRKEFAGNGKYHLEVDSHIYGVNLTEFYKALSDFVDKFNKKR